MEFQDWFNKYDHGYNKFIVEAMEKAWNEALNNAANEVRKLATALDSNTIVCAIHAINTKRTDV